MSTFLNEMENILCTILYTIKVQFSHAQHNATAQHTARS